jgi:FkbM family methyltransferase
MEKIRYQFSAFSDSFQRWLFDLPKIGQRARAFKYRKALHLNPGEVAIDLGANVGKMAKRMTGEGVTVYAYEPDPHAFKVLSERFKNNPSVICINKAVSDHNGMAKLYLDSRHGDDMVEWSIRSSLLVEKPAMNPNDFVEVEVVDIAEVIKQIDKPIGLIKMDIEGEEIKVLNRLMDLGLTDRVRNIVVETHERFPTLVEPTEKLKKKILSNGFKNIDLNWA